MARRPTSRTATGPTSLRTPKAPGPTGIESWSDPYATWRHAAEIKIAAEIDVELMLLEGALCWSGPPSGRQAQAAERDQARRRRQGRRATPSDRCRAAGGAAPPPRWSTSCTPPAPRPASPARAVPAVRRPGARALRLLVRVLPALGGCDVRREDRNGASGTFTTAAKRLDAVAEMGFDVIYLPPIHPIGEVNRKGPNNTLTPGPDDVGSPWAIGSKDGGHDAIHPDLGTIEDFDAFVARASELGLEVALDLALQCAPDHPWVTSTRSGSRPAPTGRSRTPRTRPRSTRTSTRSTSTTTPTGSAREVLRVVRYWMDHGVRIFRVDNPHTKPVAFWEWLLARGPAHRPRRDLPVRGVHPAGDDARPRRWSASTSPTRTSPGATPSGSSRSTCSELSHETRRHAAEPLRQHARHPARVPPVRRSGRRSHPRRPRRHRRADLGRLRRLRALRARRRQARAPRSTSTPRSTSCVRATGRPPSGRAGPWRRTSPSSTRSAAPPAPCSSCAT